MTGAAWLVVWLIHLLALFVIAATIIQIGRAHV